LQPDLAFALELADVADAITLSRFRAADLRVETKPDLTPVSEADRAVETALRERIARERPGESVLGEEEGGEIGAWIVDPIDATKNYVRGIPLFATLIALEGRAAVVSAPALGRRWWAARGEGAFANGEAMHVSSVHELEQASVSCSYGRDLARLEPLTWHARGLGDFWQHMLVAEGSLDAAVDSRLSIWDYAAVEPIVTEAGGRFGPMGEQWISSNGLLHDAVIAALTS
jgi:histidinol-phosphatase